MIALGRCESLLLQSDGSLGFAKTWRICIELAARCGLG
jgi:hypothetical protein